MKGMANERQGKNRESADEVRAVGARTGCLSEALRVPFDCCFNVASVARWHCSVRGTDTLCNCAVQ
jgi:hypothetical protein